MTIKTTLTLAFAFVSSLFLMGCGDPDYCYEKQPSHADAASYVFFRTANHDEDAKFSSTYCSIDVFGLDEESFVRIFGSERPYPIKIEVYPCERNPAYSYSPQGYKNHGIAPIKVISEGEALQVINRSFKGWPPKECEHILYRENEVKFRYEFKCYHLFVYYPEAVFEMALFQHGEKFYLSKSRTSLAFDIEASLIRPFLPEETSPASH